MIRSRVPWLRPVMASRLEDATSVLASEPPSEPGRKRQAQGPFLPVSPPLRSGTSLYLTGLQEIVELDASTLAVKGTSQHSLSNEGGLVLPDGRLIFVDVYATRLQELDGPTLHQSSDRISSRLALTPGGKPLMGVAPNLIEVVGGSTCRIPRRSEGEGDRALAVGASSDRIVGLTRDNRVVGFSHDGQLRWSAELPLSWPRVPPVFSPDGKTVYLASVDQAVVALDAEDGTERWRVPIQGHGLTPPALDDQGNLHLYTSASRVLRISPDGRQVRDTPSGTRYYVSMGYSPQLELDRLGNAVVLANPDETLVFSPEGHRLMALRTEDLFDGMGEFVDSFCLSPERDRAVILSGSRGVTEVELPRTPAERRDQIRAAIARRAPDGPQLALQEDWVTVRGVRLRRRRFGD